MITIIILSRMNVEVILRPILVVSFNDQRLSVNLSPTLSEENPLDFALFSRANVTANEF